MYQIGTLTRLSYVAIRRFRRPPPGWLVPGSWLTASWSPAAALVASPPQRYTPVLCAATRSPGGSRTHTSSRTLVSKTSAAAITPLSHTARRPSSALASPTASSAWSCQGSAKGSEVHAHALLKHLVRREGFEPTTRGLRVPCSDQLSYRRVRSCCSVVRTTLLGLAEAVKHLFQDSLALSHLRGSNPVPRSYQDRALPSELRRRSGRRDLNPRHLSWQRSALPSELLPHGVVLAETVRAPVPARFRDNRFQSPYEESNPDQLFTRQPL